MRTTLQSVFLLASITVLVLNQALADTAGTKYTLANIVGVRGCAAEGYVLDCVNKVVGKNVSATVATLKECTTADAQILWAGIADCVATEGVSSCCSTSSYSTIKANWGWATCEFPACAAVGNTHTVYVRVKFGGTLSDFLSVEDDFLARIAELAKVNSKWVEIVDMNSVDSGTSVLLEVEIKTPSADVAHALKGKLTLETIKGTMVHIGLMVSETTVLDNLDGVKAGACSLAPPWSLALALFAATTIFFTV